MFLSNIPIEKLIEVGKILKEARQKKEYTTRKLAELTQITSNTEISMLENAKRKKPDPLILKAICTTLDIDYLNIYKILGYVDEKPKPNAIFQDIKMQQLKVYNNLSVEHGKPILGEYVETIVLPYCGPNCIGIVINGDNMEPKLPDKSIAVINQDIKKLVNNDVAAFIFNNEALIKRLIIKDGNSILTSDNMAYPPIYVTKYDKVTVIGKITRLYMTSQSF